MPDGRRVGSTPALAAKPRLADTNYVVMSDESIKVCGVEITGDPELKRVLAELSKLVKERGGRAFCLVGLPDETGATENIKVIMDGESEKIIDLIEFCANDSTEIFEIIEEAYFGFALDPK